MDHQSILAALKILVAGINDFNVEAQNLGQQTDLQVICDKTEEALAALEEIKFSFGQIQKVALEALTTTPA